jgi:hypothetical protein
LKKWAAVSIVPLPLPESDEEISKSHHHSCDLRVTSATNLSITVEADTQEGTPTSPRPDNDPKWYDAHLEHADSLVASAKWSTLLANWTVFENDLGDMKASVSH